MTDFDVKEKRFEQDIEEYLCSVGGYTKGSPATFDRKLALDKATLLSFIQSTQPKEWEKHVRNYGADSERQFFDRFCREVKQSNLLKILRNGFKDRGSHFRVVFWRPETSLNKTSGAQYAANILHCTRQLHYSLTTKTASTSCCYSTASPWSPWSSSASSPAKAAPTRLSNINLTARATTRSLNSRIASSRTSRSI